MINKDLFLYNFGEDVLDKNSLFEIFSNFSIKEIIENSALFTPTEDNIVNSNTYRALFHGARNFNGFKVFSAVGILNEFNDPYFQNPLKYNIYKLKKSNAGAFSEYNIIKKRNSYLEGERPKFAGHSESEFGEWKYEIFYLRFIYNYCLYFNLDPVFDLDTVISNFQAVNIPAEHKKNLFINTLEIFKLNFTKYFLDNKKNRVLISRGYIFDNINKKFFNFPENNNDPDVFFSPELLWTNPQKYAILSVDVSNKNFYWTYFEDDDFTGLTDYPLALVKRTEGYIKNADILADLRAILRTRKKV